MSDIRERVLAMGTPLQAQATESVNGKKILSVCIFITSLLMLLAILVKKYDIDLLSYFRSSQSSTIQEVSTTDQAIIAINGRIATIEEAMKMHMDRIWKLGIANNENSTLSKRLNQKYHPEGNSNYMIIGTDWSSNKIPETITLTPDQIKKINVK